MRLRPRQIYCLMLVLLLAACAAPGELALPTPQPLAPEPLPDTPPADTDAQETRTLRLIYWQAPSVLNPHLSAASKDWDAGRITYEPLASLDPEGRLLPVLAAAVPSLENGGVAADLRSVTWKLKQGIRWSDGEEFSADDVLFTYQFLSDPANKAQSLSAYKGVAAVETPDRYTVRVRFDVPTVTWWRPFVGVNGVILPRHAAAAELPVGTGPYRVVSFRQQEVLFLGSQLVETNKIVYERNPFYRDADTLAFDRVELRGGGTLGGAARAVLQEGTADYAWNLQLTNEALRALEPFSRGSLRSNPGPYVEHIQLNRTDPGASGPDGSPLPHPFFADLRVRQAFSHAIDREAIARLSPGGEPAINALVAPSVYRSPHTSYRFDPARAGALLDEAGWSYDADGDPWRYKDGRRLRVRFQTTANNALRQAIQREVKRNLEAVGIEVELAFHDTRDFWDDPDSPGFYRRFNADMQMYYDGNAIPDPVEYMRFYTCDQIPSATNGWSGENITRWCSPIYDVRYSLAAASVGPQERARLFVTLNDMLIDDVVILPLIHIAPVAAVAGDLAGVQPTPWDADTWNIADWRRSTP
jgi:peptide/nickel transport system substrate-binding protein